ncbi:hypothetical protein DL767_008518 [Monosporascus sp. MG133]|nr:hypothetical protein DL767_008518 [Monosporascus sp. MG133]
MPSRTSTSDEHVLRYTTWKPVFQAVEVMTPDFHFDEVDIMARGSILQELLRFIKGEPRRLNYLIYLVGNTLVFEVYRPRAIPSINAQQLMGIGLDFQHQFTKWPEGLEDSVSHVRVVNYHLGHLNCVFTVGIDACFQVQFEKQESIFARDSNIHSDPVPGAVTVVPRGFNDNFPAIEMKAGHGRRRIEQIWFTRVPYVVRPRLNRWTEHARVRAVNIKMVAPICRAWEEVKANQNGLRKLTALISQLREIVRGTEGKCCYLARVPGGGRSNLHIFVMEEGIMPVSERDMQKFWPNRHQ